MKAFSKDAKGVKLYYFGGNSDLKFDLEVFYKVIRKPKRIFPLEVI